MASEEGSTVATPTVGKMSHSYSLPVAVDAVSLPDASLSNPSDAKQRSGKMLSVAVTMLDDIQVTFHVQHKALGLTLFELVCKQLSLLEVDYFGLEYEDANRTKYWLDLEKPMNRQLGLSMVDCSVQFGVKFYTPDPAQLEEEYTRYLFGLQIKKDLMSGTLQCNDNTAALMASYIVQADCGDYVADDYPDHSYLASYKFVPHQDEEMERRIMDHHKRHIGQSPAQADLNLLETVRRCELYGIRMHPAKDHEGVPLNLAVAHMGVLVFQNFTKINTFSWAKVRKLSFKRKRFLIKLHPEGYYKDTVEFYFESRNECKNFWKKCVEHHGFFRCNTVKKLPRQKARVLSRGSSFRYSGRTQKQIVDYVRENYIKRQPFQRSQSFRHSSSAHSGLGHVPNSRSSQPLYPVGDHSVGTPASHSCGSMVLNDDQSGSTEEAAAGGTSPSRTRGETSVTAATADVHSESMASGELSVSSSSSPKRYSSDQPQRRQSSDTLPIANGRMETDESIAVNKGVMKSSPVKDDSRFSSPEHTFEVSADYGTGNETKVLVTSPVSPARVIGHPHKKSDDAEVDLRRKRYPADKAYYIAKEILNTERTYKKDLEVIAQWFQLEVKKFEDHVPLEVLTLLFALVQPMYQLSCSFLKEVEQRLATWEGRSNAHLKGDYQKIGDILLNVMDALDLYTDYLDSYPSILEKLDHAYQRNHKFEQIYKDFELQKTCYLPLNNFILKPAHHLMHTEHLLERLIQHYGTDHPDSSDCVNAVNILREVTEQLTGPLKKCENYVKLIELQRDIVGIDNLVQSGREFVREGCLQKVSKKGLQQRMFFLFSDVLLYASRTTPLQFKVHSQLPIAGMVIEHCEPRLGASNCFAIYSNKSMIVSASSADEREKWMEDLIRVAESFKEHRFDNYVYSSLRSCGSSASSNEIIDKNEFRSEEELQSPTRPTEKSAQQRANTTVHVCWHRNTSVSMKDHTRAIKNQLSGYLLRKFKNSDGWQKLWVVFTNFCLFFYKTFQDDFPLASLPLLGYSVTVPLESDNINKDYVFKLQFKNHVYFFRAESEYSYGRWMDVICSATQHSGRIRLFSRTESVSQS